MSRPLSKQLAELADFAVFLPGNLPVDIEELCRKVAAQFPNRQTVAAKLLTANGSIESQRLLAILGKIADNDSCVRDILTTGHLGKLLSRLNAVPEPIEFSLLGLPSPIFDPVSTRERSEYFAGRRGFPQDFTSKEAIKLAREILDREKAILSTAASE